MWRQAFLLVTVYIAIAQAADWQTDAGGKMAFDVASVKPAKTFTPPNFPLDTGDAFSNMQTNLAPGGRFSATFPLQTYITFAYKLWVTQEELAAMTAHLPKWISTDLYTIEARAKGNPTKDQMRLMMQSLLADRFQLAVHFETREVPVLALTLIKPGKPGPKLRPHADGVPCDDTAEAYPPRCDVYMLQRGPNGLNKGGSRNTTMDLLASSIPSFGGLGRPVINQTGLDGRFDFAMEWTAETQSDAVAAFMDAVREQLGLKLESTKAPRQILVIDRVERPSEN